MHLVGFTIEIYYDAWPSERQIQMQDQSVGLDSIVVIAVDCGLDGVGFKPRWGKIFHICPDLSFLLTY